MLVHRRVKRAQSRLKSLAKLFKFVVCNPCQSSPSLTILVPLWFIFIPLMFFYLYKVLFSAFLQFNGNCTPLSTQTCGAFLNVSWFGALGL